MTFLSSPSWLLWLPAALLPVLLWWLFRRRRTVVEWSANYLLRKTLKATAKKNLWRQVVILAMRAVVILLLILALAQPFIPQAPEPGALPHGEGVLHQVVLVDNSLSMSVPYRSFSRDEELRSRLRLLLGRMQPGDVCEVIPLVPPVGGALEPIALTCPVTDAELKSLDARLVLQDRPAALQDGLQLAAERFHVTRADNRHLIMLTDLAARDLPQAPALASLEREFDRLDVRLAAYEIRDKARGNLALLGLHRGSETLYAGWQYHLYLDVHNFGEAPVASSATVRIRQGERTLETRQVAIDLGPNEALSIDLPFTAPDVAGIVTVEAEVTDDGAAYDNRRTLSLYIAGRADVLLVTDPTDNEISRELWRDSYYVQQAIAALTRESMASTGPKKDGRVVTANVGGGGTPTTRQITAPSAPQAKPKLEVALTTVASDAFNADSLADTGVVVLLGVTELPPETVQALDRFVRRGGGLVVGLGPTVFEDNFNASLGGLTGVHLESLMDPAGRDTRDWDYEGNYRQIEKTFANPLLRPFLADNQGPIENVRVYNHFRITTRPQVETLANLNNGDPLLVEQRLGRGMVLTWTSTLGGGWNTLPVRNMYANVIYACLARSLNGANLPRNLAPGEPLIMPAGDADVYITRPRTTDAVGPLPARTVDGRAMLRFDGTELGGSYAVVAGGETVETLDVFAPPLESDTRGLNETAKASFTTTSGITVLRDWTAMAAALDSAERPGVSPVTALALLLLALFALDAILTRVWFK